MADAQVYELRITGSAEVVHGPLSRIMDLISEIEREGDVVPLEIKKAVAELSARRSDT